MLFLPMLLAAQELLPSSQVLVTDKELTLEQVRQEPGFSPFADRHLNLGFSTSHVWVALSLSNTSMKPETRILELDNPLLESVTLYADDGSLSGEAGMLHIRPTQDHIRPAFILELPPESQQMVWLHIRNTTTALQFGLSLKTSDTFAADDLFTRYSILLFIGMLVSLWLLSLLMYLYTKDSSYGLYALYLAVLFFQQLTYVGFLPLYAPAWFTRIDNAIVVPKVGMMIIAAALYARAFLDTVRLPKIDRIYRIMIVVTAIEIPLVGTSWSYLPELMVLTGLLFIIFNTAAGVIVYRRGHAEARFFIAGWSILIIGYLLMIVDAFGWVSVMYRFPELIMLSTVVEALLLILAFVDRFQLYQQQKLVIEKRYNRLLMNQKERVENEVVRRTEELHRSMSEKETLFKELHHRVKNNLQLILSIIRLQKNRTLSEEARSESALLERRIETIAKTYEILYQSDDINRVDMQQYLKALSRSLISGFSQEKIRSSCECHLELPLREAVYIGLIFNELVTNALKYAYTDTADAVISVSINTEGESHRLEIVTPDGEPSESTVGEGLGMTIVRTLVYDQLGGTIEHADRHFTHTIIRFAL